MVIVFALAGFLGGLMTFIALWPYGGLIALASAPFGGSFLVLVTAIAVVFWHSRAAKTQSPKSLGVSARVPARYR